MNESSNEPADQVDVLRVTRYGEPILRRSGAEVSDFNDALKELAEKMVETMYAEEGIGLAAQQVGHAVRLCVIDLQLPEGAPEFRYTLDGRTPPLDLIMPMALVNPEVEPAAGDEIDYEEGCLSFPDIRALVRRPEHIRARYQDLDGHIHELDCDGILARVVQHEVDHLNGILFIDRMHPRELRKIETKVKQLKRETRDWLKTQGS